MAVQRKLAAVRQTEAPGFPDLGRIRLPTPWQGCILRAVTQIAHQLITVEKGQYWQGRDHHAHRYRDEYIERTHPLANFGRWSAEAHRHHFRQDGDDIGAVVELGGVHDGIPLRADLQP